MYPWEKVYDADGEVKPARIIALAIASARQYRSQSWSSENRKIFAERVDELCP